MSDHDHCGHDHHEVTTKTEADPVCGMKVDPDEARSAEHGGHMYFFCPAGCETKFRADPESYLQPRLQNETPTVGTTYTCPMHPEVVRVGPGSCPKCGMALDP